MILSSLMLMLWGCGKKVEPVPSGGRIVAGAELCCPADSEEEASKIAADYGIELVSYSNGIAVFHTEDDPEKVIETGVKQGLKQLSLNIEKDLK